MIHYLGKTKVSLPERKNFLRIFPCFSSLTEEQYEEISFHMKEIYYDAQDIIVTQGELVNSIYIIVNGKAEVSCSSSLRKKIKTIPIAILSTGEAIGLNDTGFYSSTGVRTATVTALTDMLLLKLELQELNDFLKRHHLESSIYAASTKMLRIYFIKQSLPFTKLSYERLQWLWYNLISSG
jgi:CRP-like cAMP-binding protein